MNDNGKKRKAGAKIADCNERQQNAVHVAAVSGNIDVLNLLLEKFPNVKPDCQSFEEMDDADAPPLVSCIAIAVDKDDEYFKEIVGNPKNKRFCCAVDVRRGNDTGRCGSHYASAVLFCVGKAHGEGLFLKLVKLHTKIKKSGTDEDKQDFNALRQEAVSALSKYDYWSKDFDAVPKF